MLGRIVMPCLMPDCKIARAGTGQLSGLDCPAEAVTQDDARTSEAPMDDIGRIVMRDSAICGGEPVFRGTRVPVHLVFDNLAAGLTVAQIVEEYPSLARADVEAVIRHASGLVSRTLPDAA